MAGKGSAPGVKQGGRPKGGLNKTTKSVKEAITEAFEKRGGVTKLIAWADDNETEFYKLWGRLIPVDVKHEGGMSFTIVTGVNGGLSGGKGD